MRRFRTMPLVAIASSVALIVGLSFLGDTPDTRSSSSEIAAYFVAHRTSIFVAVVLIGIAMMLALVALSSLSTTLVEPASVAAAVVRGTTVVVITTVTIVLTLAYAALAYVVGADTPGSAKPLFELTLVVTPVLAVPLAVLVATVAVAFWQRNRRRLAIVSAGATVVFALATIGFASRGPLSPDVQQSIVFLVFALWLPIAVAAGDRPVGA